MVNVTSRITLACVLVLLMQQASAETVLERSNRILQEINERVVNQYRALAPDVTALPKPATTANPADVAKQFRQQPLQTKPATPEMMIFVSFGKNRCATDIPWFQWRQNDRHVKAHQRAARQSSC
ncbi:hypothetical protein [Candidatus Nitrotoga sp. HW29]|uniref:hypothetical protein n=1 Tax=Candidatus Nitrotoga sp. HW29 TaxID=2886963 RepID=UPI001EF33650|nr:hypothetical protein [Candidatus Nitrotoga sp. HW29]